MRAIIPVAGKGDRLNPITDIKPKVLVEVAGKPVLGYIIDSFKNSPITEIVLVVGYLKDQVIDWVRKEYESRFNIQFVHQDNQLGLGHAIYVARDFLDDSEIVIALGDEIFLTPYPDMLKPYRAQSDIAGALGIKTVGNPSHYGMVQIGFDNTITHMVEKPNRFPTDTAVAGVYYLKHGYDLLSSLEMMTTNCKNHGEYQLTDALQLMIKNGAKMIAFDVGEWYDCGRFEVLLRSNRQILEKNHFISPSSQIINSEIIPPCHIGSNSMIVDSKIGPYASIGHDAKIDSSYISNSILESKSVVKSASLEGGFVSGNRAFMNHRDEAGCDCEDIEQSFSS